MADKTKIRKGEPIFWSNIAKHSSDDDSDAFVPGLSAVGNKRPGRMKCRKTKEVKAKIPIKQPLTLLETVSPESDEKYGIHNQRPSKMGNENNSAGGNMKSRGRPKKPGMSSYPRGSYSKEREPEEKNESASTAFESFAERSIRKLKQASLKDLRPEDKQRVANLIKELARVTEEKETVSHELQGERAHYEKQLVTMVEQQEKILKEREDIQEKLFQCQRLLTEYQSQLLNRQDKLNTSISEIREEMKADKLNQGNALAGSLSPIPAVKNQVIEICPDSVDSLEDRSLTPVCLNPPPKYFHTILAPYHVVTQNMAPDHPVQKPVPRFANQKTAPNSSHGQKTAVETNKSLVNDLHDTPKSCLKAPRSSHNAADRQSRDPTPQYKLKPTNQNELHDHWTNQNEDLDESVSDLLMNGKDPRDNIKRPFTSLIDKEIAKERSRSRERSLSADSRSQGSEGQSSRSRSPSEGRPKFAYPDRLITLGPLNDPIASSTHKSMDIRAQMSNNGDLDSLRSTGLGRHGGQFDPNSGASKQNSKVVFSGKDEYNTDNEVHSPNLKSSSQLFNDPEYAQFYKKLSPGGRKRELLKQRQALLDEQERLRQTLDKQERQLKERQYEYQKRQELQKERMEFYQKGGKFPALRLDFDGTVEEGDGNLPEDNGNLDKEASSGETVKVALRDKGGEVAERGDRQGSREIIEGMSGYETYSPRQMDIVITQRRVYFHEGYDKSDEEVKVRSRVSMATSPMSSPPSNRHGSNHVVIATSPGHSQGSATDSERKMVDVATSISYRTPLKDASNRQGNLPLGVNRHRTSDSPVSYKNSPRAENLPSVRTPGEKTLSVVELVNSMEEDPRVIGRHFEELARFEDLENRPSDQTPSKYRSAKGNQSTSPFRKTSQVKTLDDTDEASAEESKILEDIFFL